MKKLKIQLDSDLYAYGFNCVQVIKSNFIKRLLGIKKVKLKRLDPRYIRVTKLPIEKSNHYISDVFDPKYGEEEQKLKALSEIQDEFSRGKGKIFEIFSKAFPFMFSRRTTKTGGKQQ